MRTTIWLAVISSLFIILSILLFLPQKAYPQVVSQHDLIQSRPLRGFQPRQPAGFLIFPGLTEASGRPLDCPLVRWCACYLARRLGVDDQNKSLWIARNWAKVGRPAQRGCIGCIVVLTRGSGGHVGIVRGYDGNNPIVWSGNHNGSVGIGTYNRSRVIAYREL